MSNYTCLYKACDGVFLNINVVYFQESTNDRDMFHVDLVQAYRWGVLGRCNSVPGSSGICCLIGVFMGDFIGVTGFDATGLVMPT